MELLVQNPLIGADVECFIKDEKKGIIVSAEPYIQGTKHDPFNFDITDKFAATSLDNILAEYCIAPATSVYAFVGGINKSLDYIKSILPQGLCIASIPSAIVDEEYLQTRSAKLFGCESDNNVWTRKQNPKPVAKNLNLRSAGFHTHVGYKDPSTETSEKVIKAMDLFNAVPGVLIEPDNERRKLYGKAGAFRFKEYGFEHRVLSGYFGSTDQLKAWVFNNTMAAIQFVNDQRSEELDAVEELIQNAINNSDKVLAGNLIRQFEIAMP